jgi:predicted phosphohydrolase
LRLVFTADLHWGIRPAGDQATRQLIEDLTAEPPDVLVLAGDVGAGADFDRCLALFDNLNCIKALVPGNHDIWVEENDARGDSLQVYQEHLPKRCTEHGFHYLDQAPLIFPEAGLALAGSINWYDYSWSLEKLKRKLTDWEDRLRNKRFSRGRHNDARFVRWPLDDPGFTRLVVETLERHLRECLDQVGQTIVVTHHPAFYGLSFSRILPPLTVDALIWDALAGNSAMDSLLTQFAKQIPFVFSGHTHRARENRLQSIRGYNIGGDYHFKRMVIVDWPAGEVTIRTFGDAGG